MINDQYQYQVDDVVQIEPDVHVSGVAVVEHRPGHDVIATVLEELLSKGLDVV